MAEIEKLMKKRDMLYIKWKVAQINFEYSTASKQKTIMICGFRLLHRFNNRTKPETVFKDSLMFTMWYFDMKK